MALIEISSRQIRRIMREQSKRAHVGHVGSAVSIVDIITILYGDILRMFDPDDPDRDRFVLSKGYVPLILCAAFLRKGWITGETLNTYYGGGSLLGVPPIN